MDKRFRLAIIYLGLYTSRSAGQCNQLRCKTHRLRRSLRYSRLFAPEPKNKVRSLGIEIPHVPPSLSQSVCHSSVPLPSFLLHCLSARTGCAFFFCCCSNQGALFLGPRPRVGRHLPVDVEDEAMDRSSSPHRSRHCRGAFGVASTGQLFDGWHAEINIRQREGAGRTDAGQRNYSRGR